MTTHIKAQHTPGPWQTIWREDGDGLVKPVHNAVYVARINGEKKESGANAALIVAAPDMLEALELCATQLADCVLFPDRTEEQIIYSKTLAVIAKAKGVKQ